MLKLLSAIAALCFCLSAAAQDFTYRFDWHGFSNLFQATFTVTQDDLNTRFQSGLFLSSLDVFTPLGREYRQGSDVTVEASGQWRPAFGLTAVLSAGDETGIELYGNHDDAYSTAGFIHTLGNAPWVREYGYWQIIQQVPEPSIAALAILGLGMFFAAARRRK
jgi:hypothetical protein